ncbi:MAG: iron-sulfur cluster repair di-iron protein [Sphingobacteriia bacterium]|nr:iron-sulfur cluster repair di-iron protein [Sphingobacteriia bacterium]
MNSLTGQTLAAIVTNNHRAATVFEKYSLDFCCKGKRSLAEACAEKNIVQGDVINDLLNQLSEQPKHIPFAEMTNEQLISYILIRHHFYVKQSMPTINMHLQKVAVKHGERFPYMLKVWELFKHLEQDMLMHLHKEEVILFPRIKELNSEPISGNIASIKNPIHVMEAEHDEAGELMYKIRTLTNNYEIPENACTTFKVVLGELKEFEEDLHQHVHLENNILFPNSLALFV